MRALLCTEFGPVSGLRVSEVPVPVPGDREVLIRVEAAGLNYPDALVVQGKYQVRPARPFVPGMELAGVVDAVGAKVTEFRPGDPVMASTATGAFAERCAVPVEQVLPRPSSLAPDLAAASLLTYGTTLHALEDRAQLRPGETVLVLGAAGGVGTAAVSIARLLGARVIAAASSAARLDVCRKLGADFTIDYATEDLRLRVKEITGGLGVDVVYDPVGGAYSEAALRSTAWAGRFLVIGFASGEIPKIPLNLALLNERSILGVYWGDWSRRDPRQSAGGLARIAAWLTDGSLAPVISARLALADVPQALDDLLQRRVHGKLLVIP
jgi:NADPH2:quinone reductase